MQVKIKPSTIKGELQAPTSKSYMQRALAGALLRTGETIIYNPGQSNDDKAALSIIESLGAVVEKHSNYWKITSDFLQQMKKEEKKLSLNCHESGLSVRMFTSIAALSPHEIFMMGSGSLLTRPLHFFDEVLPQLNVNIQSNEGKLPYTIKGPLVPKNIEIDGSLSSQYLTGLLMAYGAVYAANATKEDSIISVRNLNSKPYIDLTLEVMHKLGLQVPKNKNYESFIFLAGEQKEIAFTIEKEITIEGDWSGAAFLLVAGAITGTLHLQGMQQTSSQADKAIMEVLYQCNAAIAVEAKGIKVHGGPLKAFTFDATDCPDLFPPLVALAAYCDGISEIKGVNRLAHKESNRSVALQEEFVKMNIQIEVDGDSMRIHGGKVKGAVVDSHNDHRIAMACAVAALEADGETTILRAEAINKSYPDFYKHLSSVGVDVSLNNN